MEVIRKTWRTRDIDGEVHEGKGEAYFEGTIHHVKLLGVPFNRYDIIILDDGRVAQPYKITNLLLIDGIYVVYLERFRELFTKVNIPLLVAGKFWHVSIK